VALAGLQVRHHFFLCEQMLGVHAAWGSIPWLLRDLILRMAIEEGKTVKLVAEMAEALGRRPNEA